MHYLSASSRLQFINMYEHDNQLTKRDVSIPSSVSDENARQQFASQNFEMLPFCTNMIVIASSIDMNHTDSINLIHGPLLSSIS